MDIISGIHIRHLSVCLYFVTIKLPYFTSISTYSISYNKSQSLLPYSFVYSSNLWPFLIISGFPPNTEAGEFIGS